MAIKSDFFHSPRIRWIKVKRANVPDLFWYFLALARGFELCRLKSWCTKPIRSRHISIATMPSYILILACIAVRPVVNVRIGQSAICYFKKEAMESY